MLNLVFRVLSTAAGASGLVLGVESSQPAEADLPSVMSIQNHLGATVLESPGLVLADSTSRTPLPKPLNTLPGDPAAEQAAAPPQVSGSDSSPSPAAPSSPVSSARAPLPKPVIVLAGDTPARPVLEKPVLVLPGDPNAPHDPAPAQPADPNSGQPPAQAPGESGSGGGATQTTTGQPRPGTEPDPAKVPNPTGEPAPATPQPPAAPAPTPAPPETPTNSLPPIASQIPERVAATMLPGADKATLDIAYPLILKALDEQGIADKDMVLYTFATISVETSTAEPIAEYGGTHARYAPYYGRGYVQLTWDYNYEAAGKALGIDLLHNPDLAMKPEIAARILAWYMKTHEQRLRTAFANNDLAAARKVVNGGTNGLAKFTDSWNAGLALVG